MLLLQNRHNISDRSFSLAGGHSCSRSRSHSSCSPIPMSSDSLASFNILESPIKVISADTEDTAGEDRIERLEVRVSTDKLRAALQAKADAPITHFFRKKTRDRGSRPCSEEARRARNRRFQAMKREQTRNHIAQLERSVSSTKALNRDLRQKIEIMEATVRARASASRTLDSGDPIPEPSPALALSTPIQIPATSGQRSLTRNGNLYTEGIGQSVPCLQSRVFDSVQPAWQSLPSFLNETETANHESLANFSIKSELVITESMYSTDYSSANEGSICLDTELDTLGLDPLSVENNNESQSIDALTTRNTAVVQKDGFSSEIDSQLYHLSVNADTATQGEKQILEIFDPMHPDFQL